MRAERVTRAAGQRNRPAAQGTGLVGRLHNARRLAARADSDEHVAGHRERSDLSGEDFVVAVIVASGGERGGVSRE